MMLVNSSFLSGVHAYVARAQMLWGEDLISSRRGSRRVKFENCFEFVNFCESVDEAHPRTCRSTHKLGGGKMLASVKRSV